MADSKGRAWAVLAGALAGLVNGLFGGGGGLILVPIFTSCCGLREKEALSTSVAVILPLCILSATIYSLRTELDWVLALPYLLGGLMGGLVAGRLLHRLDSQLLRRCFGLFLLYGGLRSLLSL